MTEKYISDLSEVPQVWRNRCVWPKVEKLEDATVASIREAIPYRELTVRECEKYARQFGINPMALVNMAPGRSYKRPKACPVGHPLRIKLNRELAAKQRIRDGAQKYRQSIGEAQDWKCKYCGRDISGKGQSTLDHIRPLNSGGTSEPENLQLLCRRCNSRKRDWMPGSELDRYMQQKIGLDQEKELFLNELLSASTCAELEKILEDNQLSLLFGSLSYHLDFFEISRFVALELAPRLPDYKKSIWKDGSVVL